MFRQSEAHNKKAGYLFLRKQYLGTSVFCGLSQLCWDKASSKKAKS